MCRLRNIALESVTEKCYRRTDGQTDGRTNDGQSDPYVSAMLQRRHKNMHPYEHSLSCMYIP